MLGPSDLHRLVSSLSWTEDAPAQAHALELLSASPESWRRSIFNPGHFTASGFVASPDGRSVLMIHHARLGRWLQPGGHIEEGDDTVEAAARREVAEETGMESLERLGAGLLGIDAHRIPARADEPEHTHVDLSFAFRAPMWELGPTAEVEDARWIPFSAVATIGADEATLRVCARLVNLVTHG